MKIQYSEHSLRLDESLNSHETVSFFISSSVGKLTHEKRRDAYHGVSSFLELFEDPSDTPDPTRSETRDERLERRRKEKAEANEYKLEQVDFGS